MRGGHRWSGPAFMVEARPRRNGCDADNPRFGFTVSRRCGTAVDRNRIRRRLRAAVAELAPHHADPRFDYVLIARAAAKDRPFAQLKSDVIAAFARINGHPPRSHKA